MFVKTLKMTGLRLLSILLLFSFLLLILVSVVQVKLDQKTCRYRYRVTHKIYHYIDNLKLFLYISKVEYSLFISFLMIGKKRNNEIVENLIYKETDCLHSVHLSLKSHPLRVALYMK